jgi:hypothetical protein
LLQLAIDSGWRNQVAFAEANSNPHRQECLCHKIKRGAFSEDGSRYAESA